MQTTIHNEAEIWASAAATGGLSTPEMEAWCTHIAGCPACKKLYEEELAMATLIKKTLSPELPDPGFERRLISEFRKTYAGKGSRWSDFLLPRPALIGAAACVAVIGLCSIGSLMKGEKQSTGAAVASANDFQSLPLAVQKTIQVQGQGRTVSNIERVKDNGDISYDIETKSANGEEWGLVVAQDGTLLSTETSLAETPAAVQTAIKSAAGQGELVGIDKTFDDGDTTFVATIAGADGREHDYTFEEDGTLSSVEMDKADLPSAVATAIDASLGRGKLEGVDKTFDNGEVTYETTITTPDGQERTIVFSEAGKLLSREVALTEAPASVRQTISQTLGNGTVEEIDQTFVSVDNVMPYEIEGQKDGKPFDFKVDPSGDFLGMDD